MNHCISNARVVLATRMRTSGKASSGDYLGSLSLAVVTKRGNWTTCRRQTILQTERKPPPYSVTEDRDKFYAALPFVHVAVPIPIGVRQFVLFTTEVSTKVYG
jgi:hypothetical protein